MRACAAWRASRHATQIMEQHAFAASHGASSPRCVAPSHPRGLPLHLPSVLLSQCADSLHLAALFSSCCCCRLTALAFCREPKWSACAVAAVVVDTDLCSTCVCVCVCVCVCCVSALLFRIHSHFHLQRAAILLFWHVYVSVSVALAYPTLVYWADDKLIALPQGRRAHGQPRRPQAALWSNRTTVPQQPQAISPC